VIGSVLEVTKKKEKDKAVVWSEIVEDQTSSRQDHVSPSDRCTSLFGTMIKAENIWVVLEMELGEDELNQ
jgi:hypothetical protein